MINLSLFIHLMKQKIEIILIISKNQSLKQKISGK